MRICAGGWRRQSGGGSARDTVRRGRSNASNSCARAEQAARRSMQVRQRRRRVRCHRPQVPGERLQRQRAMAGRQPRAAGVRAVRPGRGPAHRGAAAPAVEERISDEQFAGAGRRGPAGRACIGRRRTRPPRSSRGAIGRAPAERGSIRQRPQHERRRATGRQPDLAFARR